MSLNNIDIRCGKIAFQKWDFKLSVNYVLDAVLGNEEHSDQFHEMFDDEVKENIFSEMNYNLFEDGGHIDYDWSLKSEGGSVDLYIEDSEIITCFYNTLYYMDLIDKGTPEYDIVINWKDCTEVLDWGKDCESEE